MMTACGITFSNMNCTLLLLRAARMALGYGQIHSPGTT
jgi:hypothetical protein